MSSQGGPATSLVHDGEGFGVYPGAAWRRQPHQTHQTGLPTRFMSVGYHGQAERRNRRFNRPSRRPPWPCHTARTRPSAISPKRLRSLGWTQVVWRFILGCESKSLQHGRATCHVRGGRAGLGSTTSAPQRRISVFFWRWRGNLLNGQSHSPARREVGVATG
jgi:hypothetical protein